MRTNIGAIGQNANQTNLVSYLPTVINSLWFFQEPCKNKAQCHLKCRAYVGMTALSLSGERGSFCGYGKYARTG